MKNKLQNLLKHKLQWLVLLAALLGVSQGMWSATIFDMGVCVDGTWYKNAEATINSGHWLAGKTAFKNASITLGSSDSFTLGGTFDSWDENQTDECGWSSSVGVYYKITTTGGTQKVAETQLYVHHKEKSGNNNVWETNGGTACDTPDSYGAKTINISSLSAGSYYLYIYWRSPSSVKFPSGGFAASARATIVVPCTNPTAQIVNASSSTVCTGASVTISTSSSQSGYTYVLYEGTTQKETQACTSTSGVTFSAVHPTNTGTSNVVKTYNVKAYETNTSCDQKQVGSVDVTVKPNMALTGVSLDASGVCKGGTTTIRTSGASIGGTGVVNYSSSNTSIVSVSNNTTASATLTGGSTAGEATITVSVSGGCGSAPASKTATLTVNPDTDLSGATISFTPSATCNGNGSVASISDAQLGGGTGAWSWESGTGKGSINATTGLISGVTTATTGSHTFRYTVTGGCGSNGKTKDENVTLGYSPIVSPITKTVKAYEPVSLTCTNANVTWAVNGGETPTHYIYDSSKRSTKFKAAPGTYMVTATNATMTCPGASTIVVEADDDCATP